MPISSRLAALSLILALSACSSVTPSDDPFPTLAELQAQFGSRPPDPGTGTVQERGGRSNGARYTATAGYYTGGEEFDFEEAMSFHVSLRGADGGGGIGLVAPGLRASSVRAGTEIGVTALGTSGSNRGSGVLWVTAVTGERISGVFAAELESNQLYPDFRRVSGTFTALPDSTI